MKIASSRHLPLATGVLAALVLARALSGGFQLDDHFQRAKLLGFDPPSIQLFVFYDGNPETNLAQMESGFLPWWAAEGLKHANFRYLSVLTMQLDYLLWPNQPWLMHLHSLLWLIAGVTVVVLLYRELHGPGRLAALAGLMYALDDAHSLPTAYLANRNALLATFFGALAILCLVQQTRGRKESNGNTLPGWIGPLALALALGSGEIGLCTLGYLVAASLFLDSSPLAQRARRLTPYLVVTVFWAILYKAFGFGSSASGFYVDPLAAPFEFLRLATGRGLLLLMGQWTPVPADLGSTLALDSPAATPLLTIASMTAVVVALAITPLLLRSREARFWAFGSFASLVPVSVTGPQNRLLFFVGIGAFALLAQLAETWLGGERRKGKGPLLLISQAVVWLLLLIHLVAAPLLSQLFLTFNAEANESMVRAIESAPKDELITNQDLIVLNAPDPVYLLVAIPMARYANGTPSPRRLRPLVNGRSGSELTREDERTLRVRLDTSLFPNPFSRYHRSSTLPFQVGDIVSLDGFEARIVSVDDRGDPNELRFRFDVPLEDSQLRWVVFEDGRYRGWTPPTLGETTRIEAQPGIFE